MSENLTGRYSVDTGISLLPGIPKVYVSIYLVATKCTLVRVRVLAYRAAGRGLMRGMLSRDKGFTRAEVQGNH